MPRKKVVARPTGRPVIPRAVDHDTEHILIRRDPGRPELRSPALIALEEVDMNRVRAGYVCANCLEDLDTAFPDECPICHFPMATRQAEKVAKEFVGEVKVGPSTTLEDERAIMNEMRERERREREKIWTPSIVVPRNL